jgi:hypothetical protein
MGIHQLEGKFVKESFQQMQEVVGMPIRVSGRNSFHLAEQRYYDVPSGGQAHIGLRQEPEIVGHPLIPVIDQAGEEAGLSPVEIGCVWLLLDPEGREGQAVPEAAAKIVALLVHAVHRGNLISQECHQTHSYLPPFVIAARSCEPT